MPTTLFHICPLAVWNDALAQGDYRADTLTTEGFIHCSTHDQVIGTANRFFSRKQGLVLLTIDDDRLTAPVKYEAAENGVLFPHIYGPLNLEAVVGVRHFVPAADGIFTKPFGAEYQPWLDLRVGDRVRIVRVPGDFLIPGARFDPETLQVFRDLAAAKAVLIIEQIDEFEHPWTEHFNFDANGAVIPDEIGHALALSDDSWELITAET